MIEQNGFVGGVAGMGLGLQGFYDTSARRVIDGIPWEIVRRMVDRGLCVIMRNDDDPNDPFYLSRYIRFNPELFKRTCTELILDAGIARVVFALREPPLFADCDGAELLTRAGVEVVELPALAAEVRAVNAHLLG